MGLKRRRPLKKKVPYSRTVPIARRRLHACRAFAQTRQERAWFREKTLTGPPPLPPPPSVRIMYTSAYTFQYFYGENIFLIRVDFHEDLFSVFSQYFLSIFSIFLHFPVRKIPRNTETSGKY